ncbi:MAG: GLPGLI family protein [Saprospiraceae bacterium]|nr:GLPGLI family protein [Saprospiraceae bacterium]
MKFYFYLTFPLFLFFPGYACAQNTLKVKYTETMYFDQNADVPPQMAANMPKSRINNKILFSTEEQSIYIVNKEDKVEEEQNPNRGRWAMRRQGVDPKVYCDYSNEQQLTYADMFGKEFLIEESLLSIKWKLHSGEQRDILGYTCIKATTMKDTVEVTAWFTPKISVSVGPSGYFGLPGLILAVSEGESKVTLATMVEEDFVGDSPIVKPSKGDLITREEFEKLRREKMEEMRQMYGGQGNRMMIRG